MNFSELGNLPGLPEQPKGIVKLFNKVIYLHKKLKTIK